MSNAIKNRSMEVVPDNYKEFAEIVGIDTLLKLADRYGGTMVYIPLKETMTRLERDSRIREEFNGGNYKELVRKYNLCESTVRNIINGTNRRRK